MNTFVKMWPDVKTPGDAGKRIAEQKKEVLEVLGVREPQNLEEQALSLVGRDIYERLIKEYTEKQWGRPCKELPSFIIRRLPVRFVFDNNYFNDRYQGIPIGGCNKLIDGLLEGVETKVNFDFFSNDFSNWRDWADKLVYTGPIDMYFGYRFGKLGWRIVSFKTRVKDCSDYQGCAVMNFTSQVEPYTRIIEHKYFEMFGDEVYKCPKTVISEEYSSENTEGCEPFYPVNDERNNTLAKKYRELASQEKDVIFGGRLVEYCYYDMAPIVEKVMGVEL